MPTGNEALEASIQRATEPGFRGNLLARGQARSLIWRDGVLPADAPAFSHLLSYDLLSYGYSLLGQGIRLIEGEGDADIARSAFERSAEAIEAAVARGAGSAEQEFHRLIAAAAYHLGRFSARAYSLLVAAAEQPNLSIPEKCLSLLMLRDLDAVDGAIRQWHVSGRGDDNTLVEIVAASVTDEDQEFDDNEEDSDAIFEALDFALADHYLGGLATALLAFERGDGALLSEAILQLNVGLSGAADFHLVPQWWCYRVTIHLLRGLWDTSFHQRIPMAPLNAQVAPNWGGYRRLFVAALHQRSRAEIEFWPSQLTAAADAISTRRNLIVSLPTSAGKTRIAELCILACLAEGKKAVFITPLRALSAQTEAALERTFSPLGKSVSTLYGSIGLSEVDSDFFEDRDIVVGTPEKLDFALRSDPSLLDNVGLIVLDEGHMIGLGEREIRYEVQIQRLLSRSDAASRRIICLSAVLPDGEQLADFTAWLSRDADDALVRSEWRPTRLWFADVIWKSDHARLNTTVGEEKPWVETFLSGVIPPRRRKVFPSDQRELCLACAWRLVQEGQTVLIFCPERRSVEPYAAAIVTLHRQGGLESVYQGDESKLSTALAIGSEWLGPDHVLLKCLKLGVAVHHGALPTPYRKEIERLLREGTLPVTISSPTLAQGLNLSASAVIFHGIKRNREPLKPPEFRNVIGRAGRAYVDVEGLVIYPMFDDQASRRAEWAALIKDHHGQEMESGLLRLILTLLSRIARKIGTHKVKELVEYVLNNANVWTFSKLQGENAQQAEEAKTEWDEHLTSLDTAILSLLSDAEVAEEDLEATLDAVLTSSLFERRLGRRQVHEHPAYKSLLKARAKFLWISATAKQRRGYFLAGIGLKTGLILDKKAATLNGVLVESNAAIVAGDEAVATQKIIEFAEIVFDIEPFAPRAKPPNWKKMLKYWLAGKPLVDFTANDQDAVLNFVEQGLAYRLPWAMEAVRVRALAHNDSVGDLTIDAFELGYAVAAVETGTLSRSAALLIRSGFGSRLAAIKAVTELNAELETPSDLRKWLRTPEVRKAGLDEDWPTPDTHRIWTDYLSGYAHFKMRQWTEKTFTRDVTWTNGPVSDGTPVRLVSDKIGLTTVCRSDYHVIGKMSGHLNPSRCGLTLARTKDGGIEVLYLGPDEPESKGS
jgi:superfamily II DNA/RNA helicase